MGIEVVPAILQGLVLTVIGLFAYSTGYRWFKSIGNHEFDSKEVAQATLVGLLLITGVIGDPIMQAIQGSTSGWTEAQQIGIVLIASRAVVNMLVEHWTFTDEKSIVIYAIGGAMFYFG